MIAEALCCERVHCLPSIWVSYRGRRFKRSSPPHADTSCGSTRADYVCWSVRACKVCVMGWIRVCAHTCGYPGVWRCVFCLCPCMNMCVCVSLCCMYSFGLRVYSLSHSTEGFRFLVLGLLPADIMNMLSVRHAGHQH